MHAWACEGDCDPAAIVSNTFFLEWPPRSRQRQEFPEIDRAAFFAAEIAPQKMHPAQAVWIEKLRGLLRVG